MPKVNAFNLLRKPICYDPNKLWCISIIFGPDDRGVSPANKTLSAAQYKQRVKSNLD